MELMRRACIQHGVTSVNVLVDIIKFFSDNVAQDLSADVDSVHPILQVDAIRFLYTFRYQVRISWRSQRDLQANAF